MRATPLVFLCTLLLNACSIHRVDIQQGNMIEPAQLDKLKIGMDKNQTRFALGTALLTDPFHESRWDYVYRRRHESGAVETRRVSVFFANDVVARIEVTPDKSPATAPQ